MTLYEPVLLTGGMMDYALSMIAGALWAIALALWNIARSLADWRENP